MICQRRPEVYTRVWNQVLAQKKPAAWTKRGLLATRCLFVDKKSLEVLVGRRGGEINEQLRVALSQGFGAAR